MKTKIQTPEIKVYTDNFGSHYLKKDNQVKYFSNEEEQNFRNQKIINLATSKAIKNKDFGIKTDTLESAKAYLNIFHNIKV